MREVKSGDRKNCGVEERWRDDKMSSQEKEKKEGFIDGKSNNTDELEGHR